MLHLNLRLPPLFSLIKTAMINKLSSIVSNVTSSPEDRNSRDKSGIIIEGPKGTGKSCTLYYLMRFLKSKHQRALLVGPETSKNEVVMKYFKSFIEEQDNDFTASKLE
jgi:Cdc6-like AAA superfamily ATPase